MPEKYTKFEYVIAESMWNADVRPCLWSDLDQDEQAEWAVMSRAAIVTISNHLSQFIAKDYADILRIANQEAVKKMVTLFLRQGTEL